jgi:hypothetical protein
MVCPQRVLAYILAHPNATIGEIPPAIDDFDVNIFDVVAGTTTID